MVNHEIKKTNNKTNIIIKLLSNNKEYTDSRNISDVLAKHFATVGKTHAMKIKPSKKSLNYYCKKIPLKNNSLYLNPTSELEISRIIKKLENKNSYGYDQISNKLIKELHPVISDPLTIVYNKSLEEGKFPKLMKQADTIPLYKANNTEDCNNYRPISLLLTMSKILEKLVYSRTVAYLDKHKLFYNSQYGFRKNHSCSDAIMELTSEILKNKEHGIHTASVFIDLSKAFDTLDPNILLEKMNRYGIRGIPQDWFKSYLNNRKLRVRCQAGADGELSYSSLYNVEYGTPQGSCLGPLLFLLFTNDLYRNLENCSAILFADDTTVYKGHRNLNYLKWCLETDLTNLVDWFRANKLTMNVGKTVYMLFRGKENITTDHITIDSEKLIESKNTKFLGLLMEENLNLKKHTNILINKIKSNTVLLKNTKNMFDKDTLKLIYYAHIQSHIIYGLNVWGGMVAKEVLNKLQKIQNYCLTLIQPRQHSIITAKNERILTIISLIRLEHLKLGYRMMNKTMPPKIILHLCTDQNKTSLEKSHNYNTRKKNKPNLPQIKNKNYRNSFLYQSNKELMFLPQKIISLPTRTLFIKSVKKLLMDVTT